MRTLGGKSGTGAGFQLYLGSSQLALVQSNGAALVAFLAAFLTPAGVLVDALALALTGVWEALLL